MEKCEAHEILEKNVDKIHRATGEIYGLIRNSSEDAATASTRIAVLETEQRLGFQNVFRRLDEAEAQQASMAEIMNRQFANISEKLEKRKWTPAQIIALISVFIGPSGFLAWVAFFK